MRFTLGLALIGLASTSFAADVTSERRVANEVDFVIARGLREAGVDVAPRAGDEDFLRRVSLDVAGTLPTPAEVVEFGRDDDPGKRAALVERLLGTDAYARNWARYWRDVIVSRATNQRVRLVVPRFEGWLTDEFAANTSWDEVVTELLTATGDVREVGSTALVYAHDGDATEIAAETSRIFLGIQISCANCHDHPYDQWKRADFHELAAYFPRVRVRPVVEDGRPRSYEVVSFDRSRSNDRQLDLAQVAPFLINRFDRNGDHKLNAAEMKGSRIERLADRLLQRIDADGDQAISLKEFQSAQPAPDARRRLETEHRMPNLENPAEPGTRIDPVFFVSREAAARELSDGDRRLVLAQQITEPENPWFARAYVNRVWAEMLGEGFYTPVDDMGPAREVRFPEAFDALVAGFTESGYDVQWLFRTIALTETYQRQVRSPEPGQPLPFASALPTRLRADQIFDALMQVLAVPQFDRPGQRGGGTMAMYRGNFGPRAQFAQLFGYDPSTPQDEVIGSVPQALFLMNSDLVNEAIRTNAPTRLGTMLYRHRDDSEAVSQLYLTVLARRPTPRELDICVEHVQSGDHRGEAYEDLLWSLLNSTEFVSRR